MIWHLVREKDFPGVIGDYDKEVSEWVVEICFFVYCTSMVDWVPVQYGAVFYSLMRENNVTNTGTSA